MNKHLTPTRAARNPHYGASVLPARLRLHLYLATAPAIAEKVTFATHGATLVRVYGRSPP